MERDPSAGGARMLSRALRRQCPRCSSAAFDSWFAMKEDCAGCGLHFAREPGYWVGAVIINTAVIFISFLVVFAVLVAVTWPDVSWPLVLIVTVAVNIVVPVLFYPLSKTVWLAVELSWHPLEADEIEAARSRLD